MNPMNYENSDFIVPPNFCAMVEKCAYKKWGHAKKNEISPKRYEEDKGEKRLQNPGKTKSRSMEPVRGRQIC